ncbi:MAG TPA: SUMF1/EgtB/PvdO family nonheme iron enzyme [Anaerolineaceae bacterium]|nr:SUMF1/EgtB/PvdO family nonheme iron enzyme [Anaerolineaceae bacterium]HPN51880.1 SUMF1/EgtB/PvdO family nonheme iron enzyme [Anaerolineaceae bacterium]
MSDKPARSNPPRTTRPQASTLDPQSPLGRYLKHLLDQTRYVHWDGIRAGSRQADVELERVYVSRRLAVAKRVSLWGSESMSLENMPERQPILRISNQPIEITRVFSTAEMLSQFQRMVVLGGPGSGKTTLLHYLALIYALDLNYNGWYVADTFGLKDAGYLPVLISLEKLAVFAETKHAQSKGSEGQILLQFLLEDLKASQVILPDNFFDYYLRSGKAILLMSDLDNITEVDIRRRVSRIIEGVTRIYPECRYIITSRQREYTGETCLKADFRQASLLNFTTSDIETFLKHWQEASETSTYKLGAFNHETLFGEIIKNDFALELAGNPLALSLMAMVRRDAGRMVYYRAELIYETIKLMMAQFEHGWSSNADASFKATFSEDQNYQILLWIASHMQESRLNAISAEDLWLFLSEKFARLLPDRRGVRQAVETYVKVLIENAGLLRRASDNLISFSHRIFQEYLEAVTIASREDYLEFINILADSPRWRDILMLTYGYLNIKDRKRALAMVQHFASMDDPARRYRNIILVSECFRDAGNNRFGDGFVIDNLRQSLMQPDSQLFGPRCRFRTVVVNKENPTRRSFKCNHECHRLLGQRFEAGQALMMIGSSFWSGPFLEPDWVKIPAGEFWMGRMYGDASEEPLHTVKLDTFWMARTPITNIQYARFVRATSTPPPAYWEGSNPPRGKESHPVVLVTWHEAMAYCQWLSRVTGKNIQLASEAEWEKALRGTEQHDFDQDDENQIVCYFNTNELSLGGTTPVGMFPEGASPYGVLDMRGNVWEWTRSLWGPNSYTTRYKYPYYPNDGREDVRAAANIFRVLRGGSFYYDQNVANFYYRYRNYPNHAYLDIGFRVVMREK